MNPFEVSRTEQEVFCDLEAVCASPGYIHVLAFFSLRDNLIFYDGCLTSEDVAASYSADRTIGTEFSTLMGLMLKYPIDFGLPTPDDLQILMEKTRELLDELHACLNQPMFEGIKATAAAQQAGLAIDVSGSFFGSGAVLREPIFYGGQSAYAFQYRDFSSERYRADDAWLLTNKGFRISEACAVVESISRIQQRKVAETIEGMRSLSPSLWTVLPGFTSSLEEVALDAGLNPKSVSAVLAAFAAPESPTNADFVSLGDFNLASAFPILRSPTGEYILLQSYELLEALYESPFYWMAADKSYRDFAFAHRGAFTESFVAKRLASVFGERRVHRNVNVLKSGRRLGEIDVLVLFADRALVVQCKSKKLTLEARRGNDLQLRDDFKKSVHDAYDQAYVCSNLLNNSELEFIGGDGDKIYVPKLNEIYPVCLVSDHYPALTFQAYRFLKYETSEIIQAPFVADIFLLDVLTEMLASPLQLLSYLNRRVNYGQRINSINELTILAYHLTHNLWIDDKYDMFALGEEVAIDLDTVMMARREGLEPEGVLKGVLSGLESTVVGRMLKAMENQEQPGLINLGFMLLTLSRESLDGLDAQLKDIARRTREDRQDHDFTLIFGKGEAGLTVHCGTRPNAVAVENLEAHCQLRKYAQHAKSWFGLVVRADDGLPKFGISLSFPWAQDDSLDLATQGIIGREMHP
jgi:Nuclease-related domain